MSLKASDQALQSKMFPKFNRLAVLVLLVLPILPHFLNDFYIVYLNSTYVTWEKVNNTWISTLGIDKWVMWLLDFIFYLSIPLIVLLIYLKKGWISWLHFDLKLIKLSKNLAFGVLLAAIAWFILYLKWAYLGKSLDKLFYGYRYYAFYYKPEDGMLQYVFMSIYLGTAAGILEEVLYRSYLIRGLERAGIPSIYSLIISVLIFVGIHYCVGASIMMSGLLIGGLFAIIYFKTRNILPLCVAHLLLDIFGISGLEEMLVPLLNPIFL